MILVKIHHSYRDVIAVCDSDLLGKKFEDDKRQLAIHDNFFKGDELSHDETVKLLSEQAQEDATFNIVGPLSIAAAKEAGLITDEGVVEIQGIPFTLILL